MQQNNHSNKLELPSPAPKLTTRMSSGNLDVKQIEGILDESRTSRQKLM